MPIKKNAEKYMRVTARKTVSNRIAKGTLKSAVKATREAVAAGATDVAKASFDKAQKAIDKAVSKGFLKKNTAARKKSRLNALVRKASGK